MLRTGRHGALLVKCTHIFDPFTLIEATIYIGITSPPKPVPPSGRIACDTFVTIQTLAA
jgi:hypothetical protein